MKQFYKDEIIPKIKEEKRLQKQLNRMRSTKSGTQQSFYPVSTGFAMPRLSGGGP